MKEYYHILGIDPGNNLGISIYQLDCENNIINIHTECHILENYICSLTSDLFSSKLIAIQTIINNLLTIYNPLAVGLESAFMNIRYPKAIMNLSQYVAMIDTTIINYNSFIKIYKYAPKYIKHKVSTGDANKNDMLTSILKIKEISPFIRSNVTEHEVDAIAIAYVLLTNIREDSLLLLRV